MDTVTTIQSINLIATNPKIRAGRPYILDSTVTVADVVIARNYHKLDADGIADWYGLTLPQIYAALAYYYTHKVEVDAQIREQIRRAEQLKENHVGNEHPLLS
jgi:uncharacterized protein (DUF433 family)